MNTYKIVKIGIFTAILAVLSVISIPTPFGVPLTLQTFAVSLSGFYLGEKDGTFSIIIYIILGAVGLPIFSSMSGGLGHLFGITGGFIFGFLFLAFFSGFKVTPVISVLLSLFGLTICHILGIIQFSLHAKNSFVNSFMVVSLPYIVKDVISIGFAFFVKSLLNKRVPLQ